MTLLNSKSSVQIDEMVCALYGLKPEEMKINGGSGLVSCRYCLQCVIQPEIFIF